MGFGFCSVFESGVGAHAPPSEATQTARIVDAVLHYEARGAAHECSSSLFISSDLTSMEMIW